MVRRRSRTHRMWHDDAVEWTQPLRKRRWPTTRAARFARQAHRRRERVADERSHAQREERRARATPRAMSDGGTNAMVTLQRGRRRQTTEDGRRKGQMADGRRCLCLLRAAVCCLPSSVLCGLPSYSALPLRNARAHPPRRSRCPRAPSRPRSSCRGCRHHSGRVGRCEMARAGWARPLPLRRISPATSRATHAPHRVVDRQLANGVSGSA